MIATGNCRGAFSTCGRAGFAMDSYCHQGNLIVYETVEKVIPKHVLGLYSFLTLSFVCDSGDGPWTGLPDHTRSSSL